MGYRMRKWHSNPTEEEALIGIFANSMQIALGAEHGGQLPGKLAVKVQQCGAAPDIPGSKAAQRGKQESFLNQAGLPSPTPCRPGHQLAVLPIRHNLTLMPHRK